MIGASTILEFLNELSTLKAALSLFEKLDKLQFVHSNIITFHRFKCRDMLAQFPRKITSKVTFMSESYSWKAL